MINFLALSEETRRLLIAQVSIKTGMSVKAIEKDWWVTLTLKAIFSLPMQQHFIFKGGTSLSKAWKLIERFSEDIDIALAPEAFGREYKITPTHSYVKTLKREGCIYTSTVIKSELEAQLTALGVPANMITVDAEAINPHVPDKDPQSLYVRYPSLYEQNIYIADAVKIEFGVRSLREPFASVGIQSILATEGESPAYTETPFSVTSVEPRKTFMEKMLLLHEKFETGIIQEEAGERQSRHLSDLGQMMQKGIVEQVIADPELYATLLEHRRQYVRLKNVDYSTMQLSRLWFVPPASLLETFRKDYEIMQEEMIYGDSPDYDVLLDLLRSLNFRLVAQGRDIKEIISRAAGQIDGEQMDEVKFTVDYVEDPNFSNGTSNIPIRFIVEFICVNGKMIVHRIARG